MNFSLRQGMQITPTRKPFLGRVRGNLVVAAINALLRSRIVNETGKDIGSVLIAERGGMLFTINSESLTSSGAAASAIERMEITAIGDNHLTCLREDGVTSVEVLLPLLLRETASRVIGGATWTYTYSTGYRTAASTGYLSERQSITPAFATGDEIVAASLATPETVDGVSCEWIDLNVDARVWAFQYTP